VLLKSVPFTKKKQFGVRDIHELCAILAQTPGVMCRLPKVMTMFASRACRSAVMIGTALSRSRMETIVRHMAKLDNPWACPHGRPSLVRCLQWAFWLLLSFFFWSSCSHNKHTHTQHIIQRHLVDLDMIKAFRTENPLA
jgi:DNA mismatch repair ATPase MutL